MRTYQHGADFLAVAERDFQREEAINNVIYGIARLIAAFPQHQASPPYMATVQENDRLACAALMTPPHHLLLNAEAPAQAGLDLVIDNLRQNAWPVSGVTARTELARQFAEQWQLRTDEAYSVEVNMRVFELRAVDWPTLPPGRLRIADAADLALVYRWYCDFTREALPKDSILPEEEGVRRAIGEGKVYLWDDDGQVSLAVRGRQLPHGASVGPVYTPPEMRGRGYASACVAALSQAILDGGGDYCTLFTDLANPTSNHIYQRLGYRPLCDFAEYRFHAP
ncbi:MAG: GNAT family N-acetyltransferase [Caldilineaceae bacterium]